MSPPNLFGIACKTCRRRGRKCDRTLPKCVNCGLRGVECEGYVLRWVKAGIKGKESATPQTFALGYAHNASPSLGMRHAEKVTDEAVFFDSTDSSVLAVQDRDRVTGPMGDVLEEVVIPDMFVSIGPAINNPITRLMPHDDLDGLINYYFSELNAAFELSNSHAISTSDGNHIQPMARTIPSIRFAVAATSASHLANRLHDTDLHSRSLQCRLKATELLRAELDETSSDTGPDQPRLFCMLLLAQLDVCSGECIEFATHLAAAITFLKAESPDDDETGFIEQRIAWLDVIEATTSLRMPHLPMGDIRRILSRFNTASGQRTWARDVFHCPIDLFEHLAGILVLYQSRPFDKTQQIVFQKALLIGRQIQNWFMIADSGHRRHMNEVWRIGVLLYLIRLFQLPDHIFDTTKLSTIIFFHARLIPEKTSLRYAISWPLFQAGLLLRREDTCLRDWLKQELYQNFHTLGCYHQKLAADALEEAWQWSQSTLCGPVAAASTTLKLILY